MNIIEAIPSLYPVTGSGRYKAEFETEQEARKFAIGVRSQMSDLGIKGDALYNVVEQRNSNVLINIEAAKESISESQEKFEKCLSL